MICRHLVYNFSIGKTNVIRTYVHYFFVFISEAKIIFKRHLISKEHADLYRHRKTKGKH